MVRPCIEQGPFSGLIKNKRKIEVKPALQKWMYLVMLSSSSRIADYMPPSAI